MRNRSVSYATCECCKYTCKENDIVMFQKYHVCPECYEALIKAFNAIDELDEDTAKLFFKEFKNIYGKEIA